MAALLRAAEVQARVDERVATFAATRHGLFTREHAARGGATNSTIRYRVKTGRWEQLSFDVFRVAGSPRTWRQDLLAAVLIWGSGAAASHRAAAPLFRIPNLDAGWIGLTVPRGRTRVAAPGVVHRHPLDRVDVTVVDAIPTTTPARTLIDLAAVLSADALEEALDDALNRRLVTLASMRRRVAAIARPGRPGIAAVRRLLDDRDPEAAVPESIMERRAMRIFRKAGLPAPVAQYEIRSGERLVARLDFAYPDVKLAIEADGYASHARRERWERDRARDARLTLLGWRVLRFTWSDIKKRPHWVAATISQALNL